MVKKGEVVRFRPRLTVVRNDGYRNLGGEPPPELSVRSVRRAEDALDEYSEEVIRALCDEIDLDDDPPPAA